VCSRDLKNWQRLGDRQTFIGPSRLDSGAYDLTQIICPSEPVVRNDELWFYYTGLKYRGGWKYVGTFPDGEHIRLPGFDRDGGAVCLAVLRRDGFISLDAGENEGTLLTETLTIPAAKLFVNVDTLEGELRVELLDQDGKPLATSDALKSDLPRGEVQWKEGNLADHKGKAARLKFTLHNASLYSYWFEE
jgi:hypothetical protein